MFFNVWKSLKKTPFLEVLWTEKEESSPFFGTLKKDIVSG
jgi:hypothetical protein